jgi:hypothetical protein
VEAGLNCAYQLFNNNNYNKAGDEHFIDGVGTDAILHAILVGEYRLQLTAACYY